MQPNSILLVVLLLLLSNLAQGQTDKESQLLESIQKINKSLVSKKNNTSPLAPTLKEFKTVAKTAQNDLQLNAVAYATIGEALSEKAYHQEAVYFYQQALKYRKKIGDFLPQRWVLKALIANGLEREDPKFVYQYAKEWITLTDLHAEQLRPIYLYYPKATGEFFFKVELRKLLEDIHSGWGFSQIDAWASRQAAGRLVMDFCLKEFPEYKAMIFKEQQSTWEYMCFNDVSKTPLSTAQQWANDNLKILKKHCSTKQYLGFVRFFASLFRKSTSYDMRGLEDTKFEFVGIELMEDYIEVCKKTKEYEQVLFGHRYLATRFKVLEDYQKAAQHLATAIKYCHEYQLKEEIVKSYGGFHQMLYEIKYSKQAKVALSKVKTWKEGFSLKGLEEGNIREFDSAIGWLESWLD